MKELSHLNQLIDQLYIDAERIDSQLGRSYRPRFDNTLFQSNSLWLKPCVAEAQQTLSALISAQRESSPSLERIEFLTDKLLNQFSALKLEIDREQSQIMEPAANYVVNETKKTLNKELIKHQEWERRLKEIIQEKEVALRHAAVNRRQVIQQQILTTEQRLLRCQASKRNIETALGKENEWLR